ncbi:MAG: hypothetical protein ACRD4L_06135, partial [Pyrinomonadaceae bacterium]
VAWASYHESRAGRPCRATSIEKQLIRYFVSSVNMRESLAGFMCKRDAHKSYPERRCDKNYSTV